MMRTKGWFVEESKNEDGTPLVFVDGYFDDGTSVTICTMGCLSDGKAWDGYVGEVEDAHLIASAPAMRAELDARACDSFIVAVAAVAELLSQPFVWQALPMGIDFAAATRSDGWENQRVLRRTIAEDE